MLIRSFGSGQAGEVLGLTWELVDLDAAELFLGEQVQRVGRELLRRQVKTEYPFRAVIDQEVCGGIQGSPVMASRRASRGWMPWLRAVPR
jgi:hypothetical protein